jgi:hypothetical protein
MKNSIITIVLVVSHTLGWCQAGISVSPGKLYYRLDVGKSGSQFISITNPNNEKLEVGVSFSDWNYENSGANHIVAANTQPNSCVDWIQVLPSSYFEIQPKETKKIEVVLKVPLQVDNTIPVHNAMIFFTQLNPGKVQSAEGAAIQVTVRMGVKIYHSFIQKTIPEIEIVDFKNILDTHKNKTIQLKISNTGTIWADGKVKWELFNNSTGVKNMLNETDFFTLPNDIRELNQALPPTLKSGKYTVYAQITYGDREVIKIAELEFEI